MATPFRVLEVARAIRDEVNQLLRSRKPGLIERAQLRRSSGSIAANIRESMGRKVGADRNVFYGYARGSAEETDEHLLGNYSDGRIARPVFYRLHNRIMLVLKMLDSLMS
jgi:four helix bundle protein